MMRRLVTVDDSQYLVNRFYPIILRSAGKQHVSGEDLVRILVEAIDDYSSNGPVIKMLRAALKQYVEALVDDEQIRTDAYAMIDSRGL